MNAHSIATRGYLSGQAGCMATDGFLCRPERLVVSVEGPARFDVRRERRDLKDLADIARLLEEILW